MKFISNFHINFQLTENNIDFIIAHNVNEDKRQLELLHQQTGVSFPQIPFYDSINLVKILFPNNTQTGLEAIVNDITNGSIQQTHTALQDCDLLLSFILPILPYLGYFIEYKEIFAHDNDYEITYKVLSSLKQILPLPKSIKEIQNILDINSRGDKAKLTNFFKKTSQFYDFWTTDGSNIDKSKNFQTVITLANLMASLEQIREYIIQSCSKYNNNVNSVDLKYFSEELENKRSSEELENYKYETKKSVITRRTLSHVMSKCIKCDKDYHWLEHRTSSNIIFKAGFSEVI